MAAVLEIQLTELALRKRAKFALGAAGFLPFRAQLLDDLAGILEAQTKRRISDEKTAPDGEPWDPWSPAYAATRSSQHSLLIDTGNLLDSIFAEPVGRTSIEISANRNYAARNNAQRQFLGLSDDNKRELESEALEAMQAAIAGTWKALRR